MDQILISYVLEITYTVFHLNIIHVKTLNIIITQILLIHLEF